MSHILEYASTHALRLLVAAFAALIAPDHTMLERNAELPGEATMVCSQSNQSISPCTTSTTVRPGASWTTTFVLRNNTIEPDAFAISCTTSGAVASCLGPNDFVSVPSGASKSFSVTGTAGPAGGSGTVSVTASGIATLTATISVTVNPIAVTPRGGSVTAEPNASGSQNFTVQNLGNASGVVNIGQICDVGITCTLATSSPMTIPATSSGTATVNYTAGGSGTSGKVKLGATQSGQSTWTDTGYVTVTVPSPLAPVVYTTPQNPGYRDVSLCVQDCFDVIVGYSTPAYTSLDAPRSATLLYSSAQAYPTGLIELDVDDPSVRRAQKISLSLQRSDNSLVSFQNDSTELFFSQVNGSRKRLAGLFVDPPSNPTGSARYTAIVKSYWTSGADAGTVKQTTVPVTVVRLNEQSSPFGAGWSLAGWQRLVLSPDSLSAVLVDGTASIALFTRTCTTCNFTSPSGDFTALATLLDAGQVSGYRRTYPDGTVYTFTAAGYDTTIVDRFGNTTRFVYNGSNQLTSVQDPAGHALTFAYDARGKLSSITDPGGRVSRFTVDSVSGDLTSITDPTGIVTFRGTYDSNHRLTGRTDRAGNTWVLAYDFAAKLASDSTPAVLVDGVTQRLGTRYRSVEAATLIDPASGLGTSTSPAPQVTTDSVRTLVVAPSGDSTRFAVDAFGAPLLVERPALRTVSSITRDAQGRPIATRTTVRGQLVHSDTTVWTGPRITWERDNTTGRAVSYAYDSTYGLLTEVTGNVVPVTNYLNQAKTWVDSSRSGSTAGDSVWKYKYDSRGRIKVLTDPKGDSTTLSYQSTGFQNTSSQMVGTRVTTYSYDAYGRLASTTIPGGATTTVQYDSLNRQRLATGPMGSRVTTAHDSLFVRSLTDAQGQTYSYGRNALGWVVALTHANTSDPVAARVDSFYYNKGGAVTTRRDRNARRTTFGFNTQGRVTSRTLATGESAGFGYDTAGYFVADSSRESIDTVRTNAIGTERTEVTVRAGRRYVVTARSDANGLLRWMTVKDGATTLDSVAYGYDARWRLDTIRINGARTLLTYNTDGVLTKLKLPSGDSALYEITGQHRVARVTYGRTSLNAIIGMNYEVDTLERIKKRVTQAGDTSWTFAYDSLGRLASYARYYNNPAEICTSDPSRQDGQVCKSGTPNLLAQTAFSYDTLGNRKDLGGTVVGGNRLTAFNGYTLVYDSAGNLRRKSKAGFDQYLYWNSVGQLDSVRTNGSLVRYGYDATGRRVRRTTASQTLWYIYAGNHVIAEIDSATSAIERRYRYYPGTVDAPHSVVTGGKTHYYLADPAVGSVLAVIDSTGVVANRYRYAPFGALEDSLESIANPMRFAGREYDADTRLYYNRARYYDQELGRFISEDPIGLEGGLNQYAYAENDPINKSDPSGLAVWDYNGRSCAARPDGNCSSGGWWLPSVWTGFWLTFGGWTAALRCSETEDRLVCRIDETKRIIYHNDFGVQLHGSEGGTLKSQPYKASFVRYNGGPWFIGFHDTNDKFRCSLVEVKYVTYGTYNGVNTRFEIDMTMVGYWGAQNRGYYAGTVTVGFGPRRRPFQTEGWSNCNTGRALLFTVSMFPPLST